jgi:hypothetical protein
MAAAVAAKSPIATLPFVVCCFKVNLQLPKNIIFKACAGLFLIFGPLKSPAIVFKELAARPNRTTLFQFQAAEIRNRANLSARFRRLAMVETQREF